MPKVSQYVLDDLSLEIVNSENIDFTNANMGVFVTNSKRDNEIFNQIKALSEHAISSKSASLQDIIKLIESGSLPKLKRTMRLMDAKAQRAAQAQQEVEAKMVEDQHNRTLEIQKMKDDASMDEAILESNTQIALKQMELGQEAGKDDQTVPGDGPQIDSNYNNQAEQQIKDKELRVKEKEIEARKSQSS